MISGIINVNKERGISSNKCVSLVKKALDTKKVGHTGTLDLEAEGVLAIVVGKATRVSDYLMDTSKEYQVSAIFGKKTDTLDRAGKVIGQSDKVISKEELVTAMEKYKGKISQVPPMYSALKIDGQKLYDLARKGLEVERKPRLVEIYDFELVDFDFPKSSFRVSCSKGTYIRSLIDDLGEDLATYAYVERLIRSKQGDFHIEDAISSQDLLTLPREEIVEKILPIDQALLDYKAIYLDKSYMKQAINGMTMRVDSYLDDLVRVYVGDEFIGLGKNFKSGDQVFIKMEKVFYERKD